MAKIDVKDLTGAVTGSIELSDEIFGIEPNEVAMSTVVRNQLANRRQGTQKTKTRSEVSGGGKRPYRQKGTGRARHGSTRSAQASSLDLHPDHTATQYLRRLRDLLSSPHSLLRLLPRS